MGGALLTGTADCPLADLATLVGHIGRSAVESGLGVEPVSVARGQLTARLPLNAVTRSPDGHVSPFALATFADMGVGVAVNSTIPDSTGGPTVELTLALAGKPHPRARFLLLEAHAMSVTPVAGVGRVEINDDTGRPIAHVLGVMATSPGGTAPRGVPTATSFDPRTVILEPLSADAAHARVRIDDTMVNTRGIVHGGVLTGIALTAQDAFHGDPRRGSSRQRPSRQRLTVDVHFLRPVSPGLGYLECRSEFVRHGRTFRTVRTEVLRPDGAVVVEATSTSVMDAASTSAIPDEGGAS